MDNMTEMRGGKCVLRGDADMDAALLRLNRFESMQAEVDAEYAETCRRLDALRAEGKSKSATFRQLLAQKLTLTGVRARFDAYDL